MTNVAQAVAIKTTEQQALTNTPVQNPARLILNPDNQIQAQYQVYVYTFSAPGVSSVAGFALTAEADTFYTGGLEWNSNTENAVFINFVFLQSTSTSTYAISVDCDLPYSVGYPAGSPNMQLLCIPSAEFKASYIFYVSFNDGSKHDPQIVITPIGS